MARYTLETQRGRKLVIEADSPDAAVNAANQWDLEDHATSEAQRLGVRPDLVLRQMQQESGGNPKAVSPKGARGPMQLMPGTAKDLGVDPNDPYQNITGGVTYLKRQLDAFGGDEAKALAAYNAGPGAVQKYGGVPPYKETQQYVAAITGQGGGKGAPAKTQPMTYARPNFGGAPPAPIPPKTSQRLGFEQEFARPYANVAGWIKAGMGKFGYEPADWLVNASKRLQAEDARVQAQHPEVYQAKPGKVGGFFGSMAGVAPLNALPGGPLVVGGAQGAVLSDSKNPGGVLRDAALGAVVAKGTDMAVGAAGKAVSKALSKPAKVMTLPELEAAKQAAYKAVDDSGYVIPQSDVAALTADMETSLRSMPLSKSAKDDAKSIIGYARDLSKGDVTLSQLEKFRGDIYPAMVEKGGDTAVLGNQFRAKIDTLIDASDNGLVRTARELNARYKKADFVSRASKSADRAAERTYGGDYGRKVKDRLNPLVDEAMPKRNLRGGTPDEMAAIDRIVRGTKVQNTASTLGGMLDPRRLGGKILAGITTTGGGAAGPLTGGASLLVPAAQMGAGFGLTGIASSIARKNVDDLLRLIAAGGSRSALSPTPTAASRAASGLFGAARPAIVAAAVPAVASARPATKDKRGR